MSDTTELIKMYSVMVVNTVKFRHLQMSQEVAGLIAVFLSDHDGYIDIDHTKELETVKLNAGERIIFNNLDEIAKTIILDMIEKGKSDDKIKHLNQFIANSFGKPFVQKCAWCGKWYQLHNNPKYCSANCRLNALNKNPEVHNASVSVTKHPVYQIYDRMRNRMKYKKQHGLITQEYFDGWNKEARIKRNMVADEEMTLEEYKEWVGYKE